MLIDVIVTKGKVYVIGPFRIQLSLWEKLQLDFLEMW